MNIAWNAVTKLNNPDRGYEEGFLTQLAECLDVILSNRIKVVANAGALNTPSLGRKAQDLCQDRGSQDLVVATVIGDDISELLQRQGPELQSLHHIDHQNWQLADWPLQPLCGVAYIGAWGIVEALRAGADIVVCGGVTDASPVVGATAWWYSGERNAWDQLAGSLVVGRR